MVVSCAAYNCTSRFDGASNIKFHKFPLKNPELLVKWMHAVRRKNFKPNNSTKLCSLHFRNEDYTLAVVSEAPVLKKDAIPSVFDYPEHLLPKKSNRRVLERIGLAPESPDDSTNLSSSCAKEESTKSVGVQTTVTGSMQDALIKKLRRDKRILRMQLRRRNKRVSNLEGMIRVLRANNKSSDVLEQALTSNFPDTLPFVLYENEVKNQKKSKNNYRYPEAVRQFCLTLYFYSPKAYTFIRSRSRLPDPATIRRWLSSRNIHPGILSEVLQHLQQKVKGTGGAYLKDVALVFDSMSIRKGRMYDKTNDKYVGYVDLGGISPTDPEELATEVLIFTIVSFTQRYKCPVAYFFTNKLDAQVQSQLTEAVIRELYAVGVTVRSATCDGTSVNQKTYENLGCKLSFPTFQPSFTHPCDPKVTIFCIFDPPHMLKLCRNFFSDCRVIQSGDGQIDFKYVKMLSAIQDEESLKLGNKVSAAHILFQNKKMNVSLAAQTISSSVADALEYLKDVDKYFADVEPTIKFIRMFDRLFDLQNARNTFGTGYKAPLSLWNYDKWNRIYEESVEYIKTLHADCTSIFHHRRRTFAIGFTVNCISFKNLALFLLNEKGLKYFLPYKCSQDHVELVFNCMRRCGGWNNNPDALQTRFILRKMLFRNSIAPGQTGNCKNDEEMNIEPCFSLFASRDVLQDDSFENVSDLQDVSALDLSDSFAAGATVRKYLPNNASATVTVELSYHCQNMLYFAAGKAVRKYLEKYPCEYCEDIMYDCKNFDHVYGVNAFVGTEKHLTYVKNNGKLIFVSNFIFEIVSFTEKLLRTQTIDSKATNFKKKIVLMVVKYFIPRMKQYSAHPVVDTSLNGDLHETKIIKFISTFYCHAKIFRECKEFTMKQSLQKLGLRQKLNKTVLFSNI